ncbi:MAG: PepSY-associated TM helix domain-containing protein, partial [Pseudomonadota bacterium]
PVLSAQVLAGADRNGVALVYTLAGTGVIGETWRFGLEDNELLQRYTQFSRLGGAAGPVLDAMFPLHFGNFGGVVVKYLWFALGLGTAFLAVSGAMIWLERRLYGSAGRLSEKSYLRISQLTAGVCVGLVIATVALFHVQRLVLPHSQDTGSVLMLSFFGVWVACAALTFTQANVYQTVRQMLGVAGGLALLVPVVSGVVTGNHLFIAPIRGQWAVAGTDATLLLLGGALIAVAIRLPAVRPERKGKYGRSRDALRPLDETLPLSEAESL